MSITAAQLLEHAEDMCKSAMDEVSLRCIASRAYYSAYNVCNDLDDYLPSYNAAGRLDGRGGVHVQRIQKFRNLAINNDLGIDEAIVKKIRSVGIILQQIKVLRIISDYKLDQNFSIDNAQLVCMQAKNIFQRCEEIYAATQSDVSTSAKAF